MRILRDTYRQLAKRDKRTCKLLRHIHALIERELRQQYCEELPIISF